MKWREPPDTTSDELNALEDAIIAACTVWDKWLQERQWLVRLRALALHP
jgi:hypothetical protein